MDDKSEKSKPAPIHEILPPEIFEKILKILGFKSIKAAQLTCKQWKKFIDDFKLVEAVSCKFNSMHILREIKCRYQRILFPF